MEESTRERATATAATTTANSLEDRAVILVAPDENLRDGPQSLDQQAPVSIRHRLVLVQDGVKVSGIIKKEA